MILDPSTAEGGTVAGASQACVLLLLWLGAQVAVLRLQDRYGARFFVPRNWLPRHYDYYRPLPPLRDGGSGRVLSDAEITGTELTAAAAATNGSSSSSSSSSSGVGVGGVGDIESGGLHECVICYNAVESTPPHNYMVPPCDHVFHRSCLQQWMAVKSECPTCRGVLPAQEEDSDDEAEASRE